MNFTASDRPANVELDDVHLTLSSSAGEVHILRGIDLRVAPGETVSVVGTRFENESHRDAAHAKNEHLG